MSKRMTITLAATVVAACFMVRSGQSQDSRKDSSPDADNAVSVVSSIRGSVLPVRSATDEKAKPTRYSVETFRDEDFGTLTMVTSTGGIATVPYPRSFDVRVAQYQGGLQVVRFMPRLGTVWIMDEGKWMQIGEPAETDLIPGDYEVKLVAHGDGLDVVRLERITGATWMLAKTGWVQITEPIAGE